MGSSHIQRTTCIGCGRPVAWITGIPHPVEVPPVPYDGVTVGYVLSRSRGWLDSASVLPAPSEHLVAHAYVCSRWQDTRDRSRTPLTVGGQR